VTASLSTDVVNIKVVAFEASVVSAASLWYYG
jgi:hypothetical protein